MDNNFLYTTSYLVIETELQLRHAMLVVVEHQLGLLTRKMPWKALGRLTRKEITLLRRFFFGFIMIYMNEKLYVVQKYVYAKNTKEALNKEKNQSVDEVFMDATWRNQNFYQIPKNENTPIGFSK